MQFNADTLVLDFHDLRKVEETCRRVIESVINEAIEKRYLILANLDDYHNIHTHQRATGDKASTATHMATAVFRIFTNIRAIKFTKAENIHNPCGIDPETSSLTDMFQTCF